MKLNKVFVVGIISILLVCLFTFKKDNKQEEYVLKDRIEVNDSYNSIAMFTVDGNGKETKIDKLPESGYVIDTDNSYCILKGQRDHDSQAILKTNENGEHIIGNLAPEERCFVKFVKLSDKTLAELNRTICDSVPDFSTASVSECKNGDKTQMFKAEDDFGESYYFRGKVKDNWVQFGNAGGNIGNGSKIYWRIIRINGDGTIRLIYAGLNNPATSDDGYTGNSNSKITTSVWAVNQYTANNNMYVGYEWEDGKMHGYGTGQEENTSQALKELNTWFENNLSDEFANGEGKIDSNAGFCNDRSGSTNPKETWSEDMKDSGGTSTTATYYGAHLRIRPGNTNPSSSNLSKPTFKCSTIINKIMDNFTYTGAENGTKSLQYPIGLITADEVVYAGGFYNINNRGFYLYTGEDYWTMSPYIFGVNSADMFFVQMYGYLGYNVVLNMCGLRPVINLKADTQFTGDGTIDTPFTITN